MENFSRSAGNRAARWARGAIVGIAMAVMRVKLDRRRLRWWAAYLVDWAIGTVFLAGLAWAVKRWLHLG